MVLYNHITLALFDAFEELFSPKIAVEATLFYNRFDLLFNLWWNIKQTELASQRDKWQRRRFRQDKAVLALKPVVVRLHYNLLHGGIANDAASFVVFQSLWHESSH